MISNRCVLLGRRQNRIHNVIKYRSFTTFENTAFLDDLSSKIEFFKCSQVDSNMNFLTRNGLFLSVLNKHARIKEKRVKRSHKSAWLTEHRKIGTLSQGARLDKFQTLANPHSHCQNAFVENAINENRENSFQ